MSNYPPGAPWNAHDTGDEPEHPRRCECGAFLKHYGWDYETWEDADEDGRYQVEVWSAGCRVCEGITRHERAH